MFNDDEIASDRFTPMDMKALKLWNEKYKAEEDRYYSEPCAPRTYSKYGEDARAVPRITRTHKGE
jgi:hypothetical protein